MRDDSARSGKVFKGLRHLPLAALPPFVLVILPISLSWIKALSLPGTIANLVETVHSGLSFTYWANSLGIAGVSAICALVIGWPVGILYHEYNFPGKRFIRPLFSITFTLPALILAIGLSSVLGRNGVLNGVLQFLGLKKHHLLFGFPAVLIAHTLYNFPIIARMVSDSLAQGDQSLIPAARILGANAFRRFFTVSLAGSMQGALSGLCIVFLFCFQSFALVLILGGGPGFTNLELAIFQALRIGSGLSEAMVYSALSIVTSVVILILYILSSKHLRSRNLRGADPSMSNNKETSPIIGFVFYVLCLFVVLPIASLMIDSFSVRNPTGLGGRFGFGNYASLFCGALSKSFWPTLVFSLCLATVSAILAVCLSIISCATNAGQKANRTNQILASLPMAISPMVLAIAFQDGFGLGRGFLSLALFQSVLSLPIASQFIQAGINKIPESYEEVAISLGARTWRRLLTIRLVLARRSIASAFGYCFALSLGEISAVLCFAASDESTISLMLYRASSAYRFEVAAALACILLVFSSLAFCLMEEK